MSASNPAANLTPADAAAPALAAPRAIAIVAAIEIAGALFLRQFLLAEDWRVVVAMLALFGAVLVLMQRRYDMAGGSAALNARR